MNVKELVKQLKGYEDFEIQFSFSECDDNGWGYNLRTFENVTIADVGHSSKIIKLDGEEC